MDSSLQKHLLYWKKNTANFDDSGLALYCSHILRAALLNELEDICLEARSWPLLYKSAYNLVVESLCLSCFVF